MDRVFTQRELKWLDDIMPEATTREKEDREKRKNGLDEEEVSFYISAKRIYAFITEALRSK